MQVYTRVVMLDTDVVSAATEKREQVFQYRQVVKVSLKGRAQHYRSYGRSYATRKAWNTSWQEAHLSLEPAQHLRSEKLPKQASRIVKAPKPTFTPACAEGAG